MTKRALWGGTYSWYSDQTLHLGLISAQGVVGVLFPPGAGALRAGLKGTATKKAIVGPSMGKGKVRAIKLDSALMGMNCLHDFFFKKNHHEHQICSLYVPRKHLVQNVKQNQVTTIPWIYCHSV